MKKMYALFLTKESDDSLRVEHFIIDEGNEYTMDRTNGILEKYKDVKPLSMHYTTDLALYLKLLIKARLLVLEDCSVKFAVYMQHLVEAGRPVGVLKDTQEAQEAYEKSLMTNIGRTVTRYCRVSEREGVEVEPCSFGEVANYCVSLYNNLCIR